MRNANYTQSHEGSRPRTGWRPSASRNMRRDSWRHRRRRAATIAQEAQSGGEAAVAKAARPKDEIMRPIAGEAVEVNHEFQRTRARSTR